MVQVKVYGRRSAWAGRTAQVSDAVHDGVVRTWGLPPEKRFHRFVLLADDELVAPARGHAYLVVEVLCFTGRSTDAVRRLLGALMSALPDALDLPVHDLEVVVLESPPTHWGIRGRTGDALTLG